MAYDAPESSPTEPLTEGFDLISLGEVDLPRVASFHLDEDVVWDEAVRLAEETGPDAAEDHLGASDLLWYDSSELEQLLGDTDLTGPSTTRTEPAHARFGPSPRSCGSGGFEAAQPVAQPLLQDRNHGLFDHRPEHRDR